MMRMPPAKLARLPCKAKPMAKLVAPSTATMEVVFTPIIFRIINANRNFKDVLIKFLRKDLIEVSIFLFPINVSNQVFIFFMPQIPSKSMPMDDTIFIYR